MTLGWISLLPPLATLMVAVSTKRIIPSLALGIWVGCFLSSGNFVGGILETGNQLSSVIANRENAYILLFLFMFGALSEMFKVSGGIKGFGKIADRHVKTERGALLSVWAVTPVTFLDCCFHAIASGAVSKPLIEKVKGSKERLALVVNVTSSQLIVLIPIATTYVGYIIGVTRSAMKGAGISGSPYSLFLRSIPYNFYSIGMVAISIMVTLFGIGFGKWRLGKVGKADGGVHGEHEAHEECKFEEKVSPRVINLVLPLALLAGLIVYLFWLTGQDHGRSFSESLINADFEKAIFVATFVTVSLTAVFYALQRIPFAELESHFLSGGVEMLPPIVVLVLSWALASITEFLGFPEFITSTFGTAVPHFLIPSVVFLIAGFTSYFIGSSWATWALIMPLGLPMAVTARVSLPLVMGAIIAGGSVGDNISPLGETPVTTSAISEVKLLDHIQTTLPYSLIVILVAVVLYGLSGK